MQNAPIEATTDEQINDEKKESFVEEAEAKKQIESAKK